MSDEQLTAILQEMEHLLRRVRDEGHAAYLADLIEQLDSDEPAAIRRLVGIDFWGGSGSFQDVQITPPCHVTDNPMADNVAYLDLLLRLLGRLEAMEHVRGRRVRSVMKVLQRQRDDLAPPSRRETRSRTG